MDARLAKCMALAALLCASAMAQDPGSFDAMLAEADRLRTSDPQQFEKLLSALDEQASSASREQRQRLRLLHAYRVILKGQSASAIADLQALMAEGETLTMRFRAGALLANTYAVTRQFQDGLKVLDAILPDSKQVEDPDARHQGLLVAAVLYNQVGEFGLGRHYADQVLDDSPGKRSRCVAGNLKLEAVLGVGKMPEETAIQSAISQCEALGESILAAFSRTYLARKRYAEGRVEEAIEVLETHLPEVERTAYPRLIGDYHSMIAEYRMAQGDAAAAAHHAEEALVQSAALHSAQSLVVAYRVLYEIAERRGDLAEALMRYRQYAEADKAYINDVKSREMAYQVVRHQSLQQAQQIALLNQQNELLQLQQRVQQQSAQSSRLVMAMLVLLLATIGLWAYKTKRMQMSLRHMAETDALTGICNRHHFTQRAEQLLTQCARSGEEVALVMFDLDHFKSINDRYGHGTGDWVLKRIVETCRPICRQVDVFGRIGGEEFAVLLVGYDLRTARRMADDCRVRLADIDTAESGDVFRVTASFGVTTSHLSGYDLTRLMSHADRMLYRAKRGGRNRVYVYEGQVPPTQAIPVRATEDAPPVAADAPPTAVPATEPAALASAAKPRSIAAS